MAASPASDGAPQTGSGQPSSSRDTMASNTTTEPTSLTMDVLRKITNDFSKDRAIGQGSYGTVYRGVHHNGEEIAVKLLHNNMQAIGDEQFRHEFHNLMMLKHQNIVRLVGYCYETQYQHMKFEGRIIFGEVTFKALCLEYMHKGSLQKHISDECLGLDWHTRYKIIKGTCEGLKYLHEGLEKPFYHLDLKPDNILLDQNMVPKLADFGLSKFFREGTTRVTQSPIGTVGYIPPECLFQQVVSNKLDIFSLGVVMTKIITGPRGHFRSDEMPYGPCQEFIDQVHPNWRNRLEATWSSPGPLEAYCEQVNICIEIALSCTEHDRQKRPNIVDIIHKLNETETVIDKALSLSGSSLSWMPGDLVKVQAFTRSRAIQGADTYNEFPVLVRVTAAPWRHAEEMPRDGVDVVAVLDVNRFVLLPWRVDIIKQALKMVIDKLGPNHRLSIVSFEDKSPCIMELTYMSEQGQDVARLMVNELVGNHGNKMVAALREGAEILRKREMDKSASRVGCIMFLSNGSGEEFYKQDISTQDISSDFPVHVFDLRPYPWATNTRFMKYIADKTSGTYSFVVTSEIRGTLELFITDLTSIVAMPVKITLAAHEGVTISSIESGGYGNLVTLLSTAVLVKSKVLDLGDYHANLLNGFHEFLGREGGVAFHLVSATVPDPSMGGRGKVGKPAYLTEHVATLKSRAAGEWLFKVEFEWDASQGIPGAVIVRNSRNSEFFLKTLTLEGVPGAAGGTVVFVANSWIYPNADRVFFTNDTYLPSKMPGPLLPYRQDELNNLHGDGKVGPYKEHDRVYQYDYYNDLGEPDKGEDSARPILGGSQEHPYPRRGRTGRRPTKTDPKSERRHPLLDINIYVPRDERCGHLKLTDFRGYSLKGIIEAVLPTIRTYVDMTPKEFDSFEDIMKLYDGLIKVPDHPALAGIMKKIPHILKSLLPGVGDNLLKMPLPHVIRSEDKFAWRTDEEFAREMLAGVNPVCIRRLKEFPAKSTLDPRVFGNHTSKITEADIQHNLEGGLTVKKALDSNRLFILDHHDNFMPFLGRINELEGNFIYASRTLLFLKGDGTLKPLAIELSLPHRDGQQHGAESTVYTPAHTGVLGQIWQLAKAYASVNDSAWHQLVSHWLNTHAVIEPFIIATNRQLSVVHPVHKLLSPHYRDTMNINALARQTLINAGGIFELTVFPGKYALEMSSAVYRNWKLTEQALPDDLVKRGVAVPDPSSPYNVRLLIKDYPYAVDGLVIWWAIEQWVKEYLNIYYPNDGVLRGDKEVQAWWKEVREVGHGDLKDEDWWPKMETVQEVAKTCTTIIWVASALHAAVNFGQYPYAGYLPNRPTVSRKPMPKPDSEEYKMLERGGKEADKVFIHTITSQFQTILGITLIEILSKHSSDEVYLGQRDTPEWTSDAKALEAFKRFGSRLVEIEKRITDMNVDPALKNRNGPVKMPYTLLYPNTSDVTGEKGQGLTAMGIPNSISI